MTEAIRRRHFFQLRINRVLIKAAAVEFNRKCGTVKCLAIMIEQDFVCEKSLLIKTEFIVLANRPVLCGRELQYAIAYPFPFAVDFWTKINALADHFVDLFKRRDRIGEGDRQAINDPLLISPIGEVRCIDTEINGDWFRAMQIPLPRLPQTNTQASYHHKGQKCLAFVLTTPRPCLLTVVQQCAVPLRLLPLQIANDKRQQAKKYPEKQMNKRKQKLQQIPQKGPKAAP